MDSINKIFRWIERLVIYSLLVFMALVIIVATVELGLIIFSELVTLSKGKGVIFDINNLVKIFGVFLNVLIGLELFETVKLYLKESILHGEVILMVGLIAISRKVIVLDYSNENPIMIIAIALLIVSISIGYYFVRKNNQKKNNE